MIKQIKISLFFLAACFSSAAHSAAQPKAPASAESRPALLKDIDALGGNGALFERSRALSADGRMRVVQDRAVPLAGRWEFAPEISGTIGGDAYNLTTNLALNAQRHFNPLLSGGLKLEQSFNSLSAEGESVVGEARAQGQGAVPDIDYPKRTFMAIANVYPLYGKLNLFDMGVAHFDLYGLAGLGVVQLKSGNAATVSLGAGAGLWLSRNWDTRVELRWQRYRGRRFDGPSDMNLAVLSWQVGYLL